jgi:hypothetical protein
VAHPEGCKTNAALFQLAGRVNELTCDERVPFTQDQSFTDALLDPLADNGGPTLTHALQAGSPAIDAADLAVCPVADQGGCRGPKVLAVTSVPMNSSRDST